MPGLGDRLAIPGRWDATRPRDVDWAVGAFLLVRRAGWNEVGGFDPGQWMYAEDLDLGWRLRRAGWSTRYEPRAVVTHHESAAARQAFGENLPARWLPATYEWVARTHGPVRARATAALNVAGAWARTVLATSRYRRGVQARWLRAHRRAAASARAARRADL